MGGGQGPQGGGGRGGGGRGGGGGLGPNPPFHSRHQSFN